MLSLHSTLRHVSHLLVIITEVFEFSWDCIIVNNVQLLVDVFAILDENDQKYEQNSINDSRYQFWIEDPHQEETRNVEEKQLQNEESETLSTFSFHVIHSSIHSKRAFFTSES